MSQSTRNIDIIAANFGYMYGTIDFAVRPEYKRYRYSFNSSDGRGICELQYDHEKRRFVESSKRRPITDDDLVNLLGGENRWSMSDFIAMWQGWASGYENGKKKAENCLASKTEEVTP